MSYEQFTCFFLLEAIAVWQIARRYERWKNKRDNSAAERIRQKYQSHISNPARTSKA